MFAYCGNNPVNSHDPIGHKYDRLTEWTDGGNNQQKPRKEKRRVVIIYYANEEEGFTSQATSGFAYGGYYTEFTFIPVNTTEELVEKWAKMPETEDVYLYAHGGNDFIRTGNTLLESMGKLSSKGIHGIIYLFSCHGYGVAKALAEKNSCSVVACDHYVSYSPFGGLSYAFAGGRMRNFLFGRKHAWFIVDAAGNSNQLIGNCLISPWDQID